ncbi:hypothetical protein CMK19_19775 [Candidatus Poribacteria bacterium]|jgi:hypothetical protein|nr:hypothetical protein [Candidatus Poribacteria bacterium]MEE2908786.1 hypothetical protein [Candidatus Poribacteria bacterium]|tara:strand:+ start:337 stop:708 length:372 start_codon:yes stop_codon:yes gene_type:complete
MAITTDLQSPLFYRKLTFDQDKFKNSADEARKRLERLETQQAELGSLQEAEADNQAAEEEAQNQRPQQRQFSLVSQRMTVQRTMPPTSQDRTQPPTTPQPTPSYEQFSSRNLSVSYDPIDMLA